MCKSSIFKIFFLVFTTLHRLSTDRIRIRRTFSGSGSYQKGPDSDPQPCLYMYRTSSCRMGEKGGRIHVVTGPNSSGKSVYMKQAGLIVYLAHLGCGVPAAGGASVPLTSKLFTRIQTVESVSLGLSAFLCDVNQASVICMGQCCGSRSVRIRNNLQDPDPVLLISDPDPTSSNFSVTKKIA